jgi:TonB-dependent receptor
MTRKLLTCLLFIGASPIAIMPANASVQAGSQERVVSFNIDAQPLGSALQQFAKQSNVDLLYSPSLVEGRRAPALKQRMAISQGLKLLLNGSGITARQLSATSYTLQSGDHALADDAAGLANGPVSGVVVSAANGAVLPGAHVRISGTDLEAVSDDAGRFHFPSAPGNQSVIVEYLGEAAKTVGIPAAGERRENLVIAMGPPPEEEIVVFGYRSSLQKALNQQLRADNSSTIVSADLLGSFPAESVSEALRRVPGVAFGRADDTGEGSRITVRGFSSEAINIQLNGVTLQGTGFERTIDLSGFLADNISQVTIHKSLLPSHESSGSGGLVEIETKSGLDYGDFAISLGAEGETGFDRDFGEEYQVNGSIAKKLTDNFGIVGTVQYRKTNRMNYDAASSDVLPPVLPLGYTSVLTIPASQQFPFDEAMNKRLLTGVSFTNRTRDESNLTASLNMAWEVSPTTRLRLDLQRIQRKAYTETSRTTASYLTSAFEMPIPELGGDVRRRTVLTSLRPNLSLTVNDIETVSDTVSFRGDTVLGRFQFKYKAGLSRARSKSNNANISILGNSNTNLAAIIDPATAVTNPDDDLAGTPRFVDGGVIFLDNGLPILSLTDFGSDVLNDPAAYNLTSAVRTQTNSPTKSFQLEGSARYSTPLDFLKYVEIGGKYEPSNRKSEDDLFASTSVGTLSSVESYLRIVGRDTSLAFLGDGLATSTSLGDIGAGGFTVPFLRGGAIDPIFDALAGLTADDPSTPFNEQRFNYTDNRDLDPILNPSAQTPAKTREKLLAGYVETKIELGKFDVVGGFRMERFTRSGTTLGTPSVTTAAGVAEPRATFVTAGLVDFTELKGVQTTWTPSLLANYRPFDNFVVRLGYFKSTVNPDFRLLRRPTQVIVDLRPTVNRAILREANPDLKPTKTDNWDLDIAYYFKDSPGLVRVGAFYKKVKNNFTNVFFQDAGDDTVENEIIDYFGELATSRPDLVDFDENTEFLRNRPENGEGGTIYGFEAEVIRQLTFLPGFLKDFGILANVTYTKGDFPTLLSGRNDDGTIGQFTLNRPLADEAQWVYNASINYARGGFEGRLIYTYQSATPLTYEIHGLDVELPEYSTLDLRLSYNFKRAGGDWTIYLQGDDLLRGSKEVDLRRAITSSFNSGKADFYFPSIYQFNGGRTLTAGIRAKF